MDGENEAKDPVGSGGLARKFVTTTRSAPVRRRVLRSTKRRSCKNNLRYQHTMVPLLEFRSVLTPYADRLTRREASHDKVMVQLPKWVGNKGILKRFYSRRGRPIASSLYLGHWVNKCPIRELTHAEGRILVRHLPMVPIRETLGPRVFLGGQKGGAKEQFFFPSLPISKCIV